MATLAIPVDDATAEAYRRASQAERDHLAELAAWMINASLTSGESRSESFRRVADAAGREAQDNGWNDALDAALLRGDLDDAE